ncbi:SAM-dependent methyltransferase [Paraferrimonas sedimenticola]|uniref:Cyclopropane-fatty-acyl-phospholipid synthase n=1 Tax=Paraferrimonas sedimenticola TaxID=375674 RepID=A0AA37RX59_9GAMM|nr:cyclopropane-fatty-acyl-phospholipid synthase family protein [Paraferrimonas sedimenticola]GLP96960.1 cyclopropane-fatty-acyl-phospholipid synthase [Paraferrimonas sedimenticola]
MEQSNPAMATAIKDTWLTRFCRNRLLAVMAGLTQARLQINEGSQRWVLGDDNAELKAELSVHSPRVYSRLLLGGSIGAAESYIDGEWTSPDLTKVIQVMARNQRSLEALDGPMAWIATWAHKAFHKFNANSEKGSKKNILAHYDLGNDLYTRFLDKEMMYSSAIYPHASACLETAQINKLKTICDRLQLKEGETLLEIGTGWGGLAIFAAKNYGVKVTTTTISDAQFDYAKARVEAEGLSDQITLLKQDYRRLEGQYDKLVSIEMIEAVGHEFLPGFFDVCCKRLKPHGKMLIQAITIADQKYDAYRSSVDFIQRYIFPGGCLPSITQMSKQVTSKTDMVITELHDIGQHYADTLKDWAVRFESARQELAGLGYDERFARLWRFYLSYSEGGFRERSISTVHLLAARPDYRP